MKIIIFFIAGILSFNTLLGQDFDVQYYEINLKVPNSYMKNIEGDTKLDIEFLNDNISELDLMLLALEVDSIKLNSMLLNFTYNDTIIHILLANNYQANETINLEIFYHGNAHTDADGWGGIITSSGYLFNLGVSMSGNPHNYGRAWYPCVDNFTDKASYLFNITCQDARTAICGGTLQSEIDNGDGTKTYSWLLDKQIPTYLTSLAVGNYQVYRDTFDGDFGDVPVAIYARSNEINNVTGSFVNLEDIFEVYENKFGSYRWSRVGFVGVPFNSGAMEHAENITYPNSSINGNLSSETLYAHELAHSWFGNLVTCDTEGDMWINEGWASYCEAIFTEELYGEEEFKAYNRSRHKNNLQHLHFDEGDFWPLYGIPTDLTYSSHVYKKGADIAHSLRGHMGDDLFFTTMTGLLNHYQYQSISSYQFRDYITDNTAFNLDGFFDSWVFEGGWLHFSVDSFSVVPNANEFEIEVFMKQKLKGRTTFGDDNRVPIQFLSDDFERIDTIITISGESDSQVFTIPFEPTTVVCDMEEQISDATTDIYQMVKTTGTKNFYNEAFFKTNITQVTDSVLFRVEHNWVAPDDFKVEVDGLDIHPERYWKVDGVFGPDFLANGQFYYSRSTAFHLDKDFVTTHIDSVVVLYRESAASDWQIIPHTRSGTTSSGFMLVDQIQKGEYAFAIWDAHVGVGSTTESNGFKIFPNPSSGNIYLTVENPELINEDIQFLDLKGRIFAEQKIENTTTQIYTADWKTGVYFVKVGDRIQKFILE